MPVTIGNAKIFIGDALTCLQSMESESVQCCVTSPPYWGLRDYGVDGQIGLEKSPDEYIAKMVEVFREVRRVMRKDGTLWCNLGDSYASGGTGGCSQKSTLHDGHGVNDGEKLRQMEQKQRPLPDGLKPKDLCGIPWRTALALQADGWWLRSDIIWCLSGGTWIYARTQKGDSPMMVRDLARLNPETVQLWNGGKWTQALGWSKSCRNGKEIEFVLRSGERISCTPNHKFPTQRGLLEAKDIVIGDTLESTRIPEPENPKDSEHIGLDAAWFAGLYIAEGSMSEDTIQIAGHSKETERWERLNRIVKSYGGYITRIVDKNKMDIYIYGKVLRAILSELVTGKTAKNKGLSPVCWKYSNTFLKSLLDGYLSGDGHWEEANKRWRIGFTRNYNLERDFRVLSARLGLNLTLNLSNAYIGKKKYPSFRGEIRFELNGHGNQKNKAEIIEIRKARCREVYDIGVKDEPHLFALASGILTHNSKPNPMPESVTDRPTKSHEYIFLMSKSEKYYYDAEAIKEPQTGNTHSRGKGITPKSALPGSGIKSNTSFNTAMSTYTEVPGGRNKRSVWTIPTQGFKGAHFATFPPALIEPCILAGSKSGDTILDPFFGSGTTGEVALKHDRKVVGIELNPDYRKLWEKRVKGAQRQMRLYG